MANTTNITLDGQILTINPLQVSYLVEYPDGNQAVVLTSGKKEYVTFDEFHNLEELNYSAGGGGGEGEDPVAREEISELRWQVEDINSDLSATQSQVSSMQTVLNSTTGQVETNKNNIEGYDETIIIPTPSEDWTVFQIDLDGDDLGPYISYNAQYDNYSVMVSEELMMMGKVAFVINYDHDVYRQKHEINDRYPVFQVWCEGQTTSRLFDNLQVGFYTNEPDWGIRVVGQYWMQNEVRKDYSYAVMQGSDDDQKMILRGGNVIYINGDESQIEWNGGSREETIHHDGLLERVAELEEKPSYDDTEIRGEISTVSGQVITVSADVETLNGYVVDRWDNIRHIKLSQFGEPYEIHGYQGKAYRLTDEDLENDSIVFYADNDTATPLSLFILVDGKTIPDGFKVIIYCNSGTMEYDTGIPSGLKVGWHVVYDIHSPWYGIDLMCNTARAVAGEPTAYISRYAGLLDRVSILEDNPAGSNMVYNTETKELSGAKDQDGNDVILSIGTITITI